MNRIIISIAILLFANITHAQENKISIGIVSSFDQYDFNFKSITGFDHEYIKNPAYSFGFGIQYNLSDKVLLKSGLQYSKKAYQLDYKFIVSGSSDPLIPRETSLKTQYLNIPILLGYYVVNGENIRLAPSLGFINEFLLSNDETTTYDDNSERESEYLNKNLNTFLFSPQLSISAEYHFKEKIFITLEPYFRYGLNAIDTDIMEANSISYGGIFSINYKLK